jgi:hypothetical protein
VAVTEVVAVVVEILSRNNITSHSYLLRSTSLYVASLVSR